jgi:serine/threonine-protein kinase
MAEIESEREARARARIGSVLRGKWRIEKVLGAGGMATVFLATHRNGLPVAVKMLHPELSLVGEARKRFVNEGYAANRIGHPGVVAVLDDDVDDDGAAFLVMELLEGESLEQRREQRGGALPLREVLAIAEQVLEVLAAAHDKGVVHRDLKPENLFVTREGRLKILDFGLARLQELSGDARLTASNGGIMGTPAFLPPEQARGRWSEIDARTDLWAVGATMFTLASGRYVHEAGTLNEMLAAAITRPAPSFTTVRPGASSAFVAVVDRALAVDPAARYQDARAMADAVRGAFAGTAEEPSSPGPPLAFSPTLVSGQSAPTPHRPPSPGRRRAVLVALAALSLGAALAAVGVGASRARPAPAAPATAEAPAAAEPPRSEPAVTAAQSAAPPAAASAHVDRGPRPPVAKRPPPAPSAAPTEDPLDRRH